MDQAMMPNKQPYWYQHHFNGTGMMRFVMVPSPEEGTLQAGVLLHNYLRYFLSSDTFKGQCSHSCYDLLGNGPVEDDLEAPPTLGSHWFPPNKTLAVLVGFTVLRVGWLTVNNCKKTWTAQLIRSVNQRR